MKVGGIFHNKYNLGELSIVWGWGWKGGGGEGYFK